MSVQVDGPRRTFKTLTDLSAKQHYIVQLTADETIALASAATQVLVGVLEGKPLAGENANVFGRWGGGTGKVKAGGTIHIGDHFTSDSAGKAVATTSGGDEVVGRALQEAVDGDVFEYTPSNEKYRTS